MVATFPVFGDHAPQRLHIGAQFGVDGHTPDRAGAVTEKIGRFLDPRVASLAERLWGLASGARAD